MIETIFYVSLVVFVCGFITGSMVGASVERDIQTQEQAMRERQV